LRVGVTYKGRQSPNQRRKILEIGSHLRPPIWWSPAPRPNEAGVRYEQNGAEHIAYISTFASWAEGSA
jgi:hypothetical protein